MPVPHELNRKLQEALGDRAGDALADWLNQSEIQYAAVRQEIAEFRRDMRADLAELRQHTDSRLADLRQDMHRQLADVREEMRVGFAQVDVRFAQVDARFAQVDARFAQVDARFAEVDAKFAAQDSAMAQRFTDFMKWMLGFWAASLVTIVGSLVGLAIVFR